MQRIIIFSTYFLLFGILFFACKGQSSPFQENRHDSVLVLSQFQKDSLEAVLERKVLDTVSNLPDVKERRKLIQTSSGGNRYLKIRVAGKPGIQKFYWIAVGEHYGKNEVTHFNFHVYPDSMRIVFYDAINAREIPLDKWRERDK